MSTIINKNYAIGVFDSGLGGLTVVKEIMKALPEEDIVYFGDTARVPYGTKSKETIIRFSQENVHLLIKYNVKMIVVACNTASSYALPILQKTFAIPLMGVIEPGAKRAASLTKNNRVGVIATSATINSQEYVRQIKKLKPSAKVIGQACPLFVPLVEEGWFDKDITASVAREYLSKIKKFKVDTLILGCTHYPLLKGVLQKVMGPKVDLVDSAQVIACEVKNLLENLEAFKPHGQKPRYEFLVSDEPQHFRKLARKFLTKAIENVSRAPSGQL